MEPEPVVSPTLVEGLPNLFMCVHLNHFNVGILLTHSKLDWMMAVFSCTGHFSIYMCAAAEKKTGLNVECKIVTNYAAQLKAKLMSTEPWNILSETTQEKLSIELGCSEGKQKPS